MAAYRLELDIGEDDWVSSESQSPFHGAWLAASDYKVWLLAFTVFGVASSGTVTTMFPTVVKSLGYNDVETLFLTVPPYVIAVIAILTNAWHADRVQNRWLHIALPPTLAIASFIICAATTKLAARYFAMCIMVGSIFSAYVVALGWVSSCIPRPAAKRAATLGAVNTLCNMSQVYGPFLYPESDAPRYVMAFCVNTATALLTIILAVILRIVLARLNRQLDRGALQHTAVPLTVEDGAKHRRNSLEHRGLPGEAVDRGFRFVL
jgi:Major Facilitator Superfamily